tara:strand:+ start:18505 stop:19338 length:834 start_codon:yes stop_codon:yes gene_type:complete
MSDKKISELTQITSANPITDVLPIVDISLNQTDKITIAKLPMSASAIARSYPYTIDFISGTEQTRDLTVIDTSSGYQNNSNLELIYIGSHVTSIGDSAFYNSNTLTSITIPNSVTSIGSSAFSNCSGLTSVTILDGVGATSIGNTAFGGNANLTSITIPNSVTSIGEQAFFSCGLTSITIGNGVTSIGVSAFFDCTSLASVTIGNSVTTISSNAFNGCTSLATITSLATDAPSVVTNSFNNVAATTITVPVGATVSYQTAGDGTTYGGLIIAELEEA